MSFSRFATVEEVLSEEFSEITRVLDSIAVKYSLPDHSDVNQERYPWAEGLLHSPALYASRMWEYPFAVLSAELQPGMRCADVGCGMNAFTIYLKEIAGCNIIGIDPDVFGAGVKYKSFGVSREFARKTGLQIVQCGIESISLSSNSFDRVFCLSVVEHLRPDVGRRGVQEIARILKPGGRAIITVDINMLSEISRPLDLIWESGLLPAGDIDLRWPTRRLGIYYDGKQPADVFGMTLVKYDYPVETQYPKTGEGSTQSVINASLVPTMRRRPGGRQATNRPLWRRIGSRIKRAWLVLLGK